MAIPPTVGPTPGFEDVPAQVGRYRILRLLGGGGMGRVYLAEDTRLARQVALKVLAPNLLDRPDARERFCQEARAAATLQHPNLCPVFDVGEENGLHFLTMAYIEGQPLSSLLRGGEPLPPRQVAALVCKLARAMHEAHSRGVIHRDLKPGNIIITAHHEPVIVDFGLARRSDDVRQTREGQMLGTPAYMPPEQVRGEAGMGPGCDIYSLGVILYELLTGRLPFTGSLTEVLGQVLGAEPAPPSRHRSGVDPVLESICLQAMAKRVEDRHATAEQLAAALSAYLEGAEQPTGDIPGTLVAPALQPTVPIGEAGMTSQLVAELLARLDERHRPRGWARWLWPGVAALALLAGLLVMNWALNRPPQVIVVRLSNLLVNPADTKLVYLLDGKRMEPRELRAELPLSPGEHRLVVDRDGKRVEDRVFHVGADDAGSAVLVPPEEDAPEVAIKGLDGLLAGEPRAYLLDGEKKTGAELIAPFSLKRGLHRLEAQAQDKVHRYSLAVAGEDKGQRIAAVPLDETPVPVRLEVAGLGPDSMEAKVFLDGEPADLSGPVRLLPGRHELKVKRGKETTSRHFWVPYADDVKDEAVPLTVEAPEPPPKPLAAELPVPQGETDLAFRGHGGNLADVPAEHDDSYASRFLIEPSETVQGYSPPGECPLAVVIGFRGDKAARISEVRVNPATRDDRRNWARRVQIEISKEYPFAGFEDAGEFDVAAEERDTLCKLPAVRVGRYVRVSLLRNGGGGWMQAGRMKVIGTLLPEAEQPKAPAPLVNVAAARNGGKAVRWTSEYDAEFKAANLTDGNPGQTWSGTSETSQMVVIRLGRPARVRCITINPYSRGTPAYCATEASVWLSPSSPVMGFKHAGTIRMDPIGRDHALTLQTPVVARYVKIVFLKNNGGGWMYAHEVKVFADTEPVTADPESPEINLASAANGGVLADAPVQYDAGEWAARNLVNKPGPGAFAAAKRVPLSMVVGFRGGKAGRITAIGVNPQAREDPKNWVRKVQVEISRSYPFAGFEPAGAIDILPVANDALLPLKEPLVGRYVRFTFLDNGGGGYLEANELLVMGTLLPDAEQPPAPPALVNIAARANGGEVRAFTSEHSSDYRADQLIETKPGGGWLSANDKQQSVVIRLGKMAAIHHVAVNPYTAGDPKDGARAVKILAALVEKGPFEDLGTLKLTSRGQDHTLTLKQPVQAQFVKIEFLSNGGGSYFSAHTIKVFGQPLARKPP